MVIAILAVPFGSMTELYLGYWISVPLTTLVQSSFYHIAQLMLSVHGIIVVR